MNSNAIEKTAVSHLNLAITQCEFLRTCVRSNYCTQLLSSRSSQRFVEQNSRTLSQNEERKAGLSENPTQALSKPNISSEREVKQNCTTAY